MVGLICGHDSGLPIGDQMGHVVVTEKGDLRLERLDYLGDRFSTDVLSLFLEAHARRCLVGQEDIDLLADGKQPLSTSLRV